jgi:hypothetical protein
MINRVKKNASIIKISGWILKGVKWFMGSRTTATKDENPVPAAVKRKLPHTTDCR